MAGALLPSLIWLNAMSLEVALIEIAKLLLWRIANDRRSEMSFLTRRLAAMALPLLVLGACTSLTAEDRALLEQTRTAAQDAKAAASRAETAAMAAERNSAAAAASAQRSAEQSGAAAERADRMFQRTQRKGAGS